MNKTSWRWNSPYRAKSWIPLIWIVLLFLGCQASTPPLSPGAAAFKTEVGRCLRGFSAALVEPVFKKDLPAINAILKESQVETTKLCRMCPFRTGVLDQQGSTLALYPPRDKSGNFSSYALVTKTINTGKIQHQSFYLQDGSQIYIVSAPLIRNDIVIGLIVILIRAEEAGKRWGLTPQEFKTLDFNT